MKKTIYLLIYCTGYTSETEVEIVTDKGEAEQKFRVYKNDLRNELLNDSNFDIDIYHATEKELQEADIYIEENNITYDRGDIYVSYTLQEQEIEL